MTSLFNPMTTIGKMVKPFRHPYKGIVVQVEDDPNYIGRIKVDVPELFGDYEETAEGSTAGILPWIYPRYFGKFAGMIDFEVPEKGDIVEVIFPYEVPYVGYYTNKPVAKDIWDKIAALGEEGTAIAQRFKDYYPNVYGHLDKNLTGWYVDKTTNEIFIVQGGQKCNIGMLADGTLKVSTPTNMIFEAGQSIKFTATTSIDMQTETLNETATNIKTKGTHEHDGTMTATQEGTFNNITVSGHTHTVPQSPSGTQESQSPTAGT